MPVWKIPSLSDWQLPINVSPAHTRTLCPALSHKKECALAHSRAEARLPRQPSTPAPSAHPRGAFLSYGNEVSYTIKNPASQNEKSCHPANDCRRDSHLSQFISIILQRYGLQGFHPLFPLLWASALSSPCLCPLRKVLRYRAHSKQPESYF